MSGIAGFVRLDGSAAEQSSVRRMVGRMAHRGPDGSEIWCGATAALGHLMLHTTPESLHETMPRASRDGLRVVTADARIDNRDELIAQLSLTPQRGGVITDSDVILAAFRKWGEECPERLVGDFAFAIWDIETQRLFCARDHMGVKPFYYTLQEGRLFAFASEIKGLLALPEVPELLNEVRLADYLSNEGRHDREITIFKGVLRLPPASYLTVSRSEITSRRYWQPTIRPSGPILSDSEYAEKFAEIFTEAVRCRVRSAYPVATQLSGGLDSSYVTCVARDLLRKRGQPLHTLSMTFEESPECDEKLYIQAILEDGGLVPHLASGDEIGPLSHLDEIFAYLDDAATGGNHHMIWECCRLARESGARVLLDGIDGDTVVSHGLEYFTELARAGEWARFGEEMKAARQEMSATPDKHSFHAVLGSPRKLLNRFAVPEVLAQADRGETLKVLTTLVRMRRHLPLRFLKLLKICARRLLAAKLGRSIARPAPVSLPEQLNDEFIQGLDLRERLEASARIRTGSPTVRDQQVKLLESNVFPHMMELTDHYAAAHSLDVRHPFLDLRLVEFCLSLPPDQSLRKGWTRVVMRNAMKGVVPEVIRTRRGKTNLAAAFDRGLFQIDATRLDEALAPGCPLDAFLKRECIEALCAGGRDQSGPDIWLLCHHAIVSTWLRKRGFASAAQETRWSPDTSQDLLLATMSATADGSLKPRVPAGHH